MIQVAADETSIVDLGLIEDAEGDLVIVKEFKVLNPEFRAYVSLVD